MVDVQKREDWLIDVAQGKERRIKLALTQIDIFEKGSGLTENEIRMLNLLKGILTV